MIPVLHDELADLLDDASPAEDAASDEMVRAFMAAHTEASRPQILAGWVSALTNKCAEGSRHNGWRSVAAGAAKEARAGYFPAQLAYDTLEKIFVAAATRAPTGGERQRTEREATDEYDSLWAWGIGQALAADLDAVRARTAEKMPDNVEWTNHIGVNGDAPSTPAEPPEPPDVAAANHSGQVRMAYRLARAYKDNLLHVHGIGWHYWDGKRWAEDDRGAARRAVLHVLKVALAASLNDKELRADVRRCESGPGVAGVLTIAAALKEFAATVDDLDADPWLLNCANGTFDLHTLQMRGADPSDRITKVCRAAYHEPGESLTTGAWAAFLKKVLPDKEVRDYLQRLMGVALLGKVIEHVLAILTGTGFNGKSKFYDAMLHALGDYAAPAEPELFMHRDGAHPTGEMDLLGRRLIVVSETEENRRLAVATVKRLTGGDRMKARRMRQDFVDFPPNHLPLLVTNHLPVISGGGESIWGRIRVIPFTVFIPEGERDHHLSDKLAADADAVLAWAVAGWLDYTYNGLSEPDAVLVATNNYRVDSDAVARFITDECHRAAAVKMSAGDLFDAWDHWRKINNADEISKKSFGQALSRLGYHSTDSNGKRWWHGLCILKSEEQ
jgi:putative DNA primase/helicase